MSEMFEVDIGCPCLLHNTGAEIRHVRCIAQCMSHHVTVWIDHLEAKIFQIEPESFEMTKVVSPHHHVTRKMAEQGTHTDAHGFYHELAIALKGTKQLLLVGPGSAKLDFIRYLQNHERALEATICGVETLDHPTDPQLVAYVRQYFKAKDRAG